MFSSIHQRFSAMNSQSDWNLLFFYESAIQFCVQYGSNGLLTVCLEQRLSSTIISLSASFMEKGNISLIHCWRTQHKHVSAGALGLVKVPGISEITTVRAAGLSI